MTASHPNAFTHRRQPKCLALLAAYGLSCAIPAAAQSNEHISCQQYQDLTPSKRVGTGIEIDLRNGRPAMTRARYNYGITYLATSQSAAKPNEILSAKIDRSWPAPDSYISETDRLSRPSTRPNLSVEIKVPLGASLSRRVIVRFLRGRTLIAEASGTLDVRSERDDYVLARLRVALPEEVTATQAIVDAQIFAEGDGRRVASARFELSGFGESDWHRANKYAGLVLGADRQSVTSMGATCKRTPSAR